MKVSVVSLFVCISLVGCLPESPLSPDEDSGAGGGESSGELTVDLTLGTSSPSNIDYPVTVRARIEGSKGAQYELSLNDSVIESARLPSTGTNIGGPFSGTEGPTNYRYVYFVIGEPGGHRIDVSLTRGDETVLTTESLTIGSVCDANENFYAQANLSTRFSCGNCHEPGGNASFIIDGSSYASIAQTDKYTSSNPYIMANMPANLDPTPEGRGGELVHSGGEKWTQSSPTHIRMLELAYRVANDFSCPN